MGRRRSATRTYHAVAVAQVEAGSLQAIQQVLLSLAPCTGLGWVPREASEFEAGEPTDAQHSYA